MESGFSYPRVWEVVDQEVSMLTVKSLFMVVHRHFYMLGEVSRFLRLLHEVTKPVQERSSSWDNHLPKATSPYLLR